MDRARSFDRMTGFQLLEQFYMQGLQPHFLRAQQLVDFRTDNHVDDADAMNDVLKAIRIEVNNLSNSNAGMKITQQDIETYIDKKIRSKE